VRQTHSMAHAASGTGCETAPVGALLVVDAQVDVLGDPNPVPAADAVIARLRALLSAARTAGALIVHLQNDGPPGAPDEPGTPGWEIHPDVAPARGERVVRKTTDDGFAGTALGAFLEEAGVRRVAVAGLLSEMCVSATVRGALARGLGVVLVRDAHATYPVEEIPAEVVSRVAAHALGDGIEQVSAADVRFVARPRPAPAQRHQQRGERRGKERGLPWEEGGWIAAPAEAR
jgi:streptothricin hydrolase